MSAACIGAIWVCVAVLAFAGWSGDMIRRAAINSWRSTVAGTVAGLAMIFENLNAIMNPADPAHQTWDISLIVAGIAIIATAIVTKDDK